MSLYFVRHGQTDWNQQHKLQGKSDIPLNDTGRAQAAHVGEQLKDTHIDKIYCSPLQRALETAQIINDKHHCEILLDARIAERSFGELEGTLFDSGRYLWDFNDPRLHANAEHLEAFFTRVQSFLIEKEAEFQAQSIWIVAHGGVYLPCHEYFFDMDRNSDLMRLLPQNCGVTKLLKTDNELKRYPDHQG